MKNVNGNSQNPNYQHIPRNPLHQLPSSSQPNPNLIHFQQVGLNSESAPGVVSLAAPQAPRRLSDRIQFPSYMRPFVDRIDYNLSRYMYQVSLVWDDIGLNEAETNVQLTSIEQILITSMKNFFDREREGLTSAKDTIEKLTLQMRTLSLELGIREPEPLRGKQLSLIAQAQEIQNTFDGLVDMKNKRLSLWSQLLLLEKFHLLLVGRVPDHHEQVTLPSEDMLCNLKSTISGFQADQESRVKFYMEKWTELNQIVRDLDVDLCSDVDGRWLTDKSKVFGYNINELKFENLRPEQIEDVPPVLSDNWLRSLSGLLDRIKGLRSEREREIQSKREKLEALFNRLNVPDAERVRVTNTIPKSITPATINKLSQVVEEYDARKRQELPKVIEQMRIEIRQLQTQFYYSDFEKEQFAPMKLGKEYFDDGLCELHEREIERLHAVFERHREYFEAVRNWKKDWEEYNYTEEMRKKPEALANRGGILLVYEKRMKELRKNLARIQQAIAAYVSTNSDAPRIYGGSFEDWMNAEVRQQSERAAQAKDAISSQKARQLEQEMMRGAQPAQPQKFSWLGNALNRDFAASRLNINATNMNCAQNPPVATRHKPPLASSCGPLGSTTTLANKSKFVSPRTQRTQTQQQSAARSPQMSTSKFTAGALDRRRSKSVMTLNQIRNQMNAENSPMRTRGGAPPDMQFRVPMPPAPLMKSKIPAPTSRLPQPTRPAVVAKPVQKPAAAYQPLPSNPASSAAGASAFAKPAVPYQIIMPLPDFELPRAPSACSGKSSTSSVTSLPIGASAGNLYAAANSAPTIPPPPAAYAGSTASSASSAGRSTDKNAAACAVSSSQQPQVSDAPSPYFDSGFGASRLRPGDPSSVVISITGPPSQHSGSGSGHNVPQAVPVPTVSAVYTGPTSYAAPSIGTFVAPYRDSIFPNPMVPVPLPRTQFQTQMQQFPNAITSAPITSAQFSTGFSEMQQTGTQTQQYSMQQQFLAPNAVPQIREQQVFAVPASLYSTQPSAVSQIREQAVFAVPAPFYPSQPSAVSQTREQMDFAVPSVPFPTYVPPVSSTSVAASSNRRMASAGVQTSNLFEAPSNYMLVSHIGAAAAGQQPDLPAVPSSSGPSLKSTTARFSFDEVDPPMNSTLSNAQLQGPRAVKGPLNAVGQRLIGSPHGDEPVLTGSHRNQLPLSPLQPIGNAFENPTQPLKSFAMPSSTPAGTLALGGGTSRLAGIGDYMIEPQFLDVGDEVTIAQQENTSRALQTGYAPGSLPRVAPAPSNAIAAPSDARPAADNARFGFPTLDLSYK